jgi:hypothetical protein
MSNSNKPRLPDKSGFNLLVGLILAIAIVAFAIAVFDRPLATPLLTTGILAIVLAFFIAMFRHGRRDR